MERVSAENTIVSGDDRARSRSIRDFMSEREATYDLWFFEYREMKLSEMRSAVRKSCTAASLTGPLSGSLFIS
jgi:hypothetical protein